MPNLRIHGGTLVSGGREPFAADILIRSQTIQDIVPSSYPATEDYRTLDAAGLYVSPGFVEIHSHGGGGSDYMDKDPEAYPRALRAHRAHGTTAVMPTSLSADAAATAAAVLRYKAAEARKDLACCMLGMHLEGPYLSPAQAGAQKKGNIRSFDPGEYCRLNELAQGSIKRWSVAPELGGAAEFAKFAQANGIALSIAHSDADFDTVLRAFDMGYRHITHLYSGMSSVSRRGGFRIAGVVEAAYYLDGMNVELIADGCHLPDSLLRLVTHCKKPEHIALITDSMRAAGTDARTSFLGSPEDPVPVIIEDGVAKLPSRDCFGGSIATSDRLIRTMCRAGTTLTDAVAMATVYPLKMMGLNVKKGLIAPDYDADLCIFDKNIQMRHVLLGGEDFY